MSRISSPSGITKIFRMKSHSPFRWTGSESSMGLRYRKRLGGMLKFYHRMAG
jgi:hypothetical protein